MTEQDHLKQWLSADAAALMELLFELSQIADDFVDDDQNLDRNAAMNRLLMLSLVLIPMNTFYLTYSTWFKPLISASIMQWSASNAWEKQTGDIKTFAWAMRDIAEVMIAQMALLEKGSEHALKVSIEVGQYFRSNEDAESPDNFGVRT